LLIWLTGLLGAYYLVNKPLTTGLVLNGIKAFAQIASAVLIVAIGGGLGRRLLSWLQLNKLTQLSIQAAVGVGILSTGYFILGSLIGNLKLLGWGLLGVLSLWLRRDMLLWLSDFSSLGWLWKTTGRFGKIAALLLGFLCALTLLASLAPAIKFDALVYHLSLPQRYLAADRFEFVPDNMFWGMPQLGEALFTWAAAIAGLQAGVLLAWAVGILSILGTAGYTAERLGADAAWTAAASLMGGYSLADALGWGYVDWITVLYGLGVVVLLAEWKDRNETKYVLVAGVMAGMALSTKYTGGVVILASLIVLIPDWRTSLLFFSTAGISSLTWWIKNFLLTGNPFYPFFLPAGNMTPLRLALYQNQPAWGGLENVFLLPWQATVNGLEGASGFSASIGPLLLGLGILSIFPSISTQHQQYRVRDVAIFLASGLLVWAIAGRLSGLLIQSRLYWSLFPAAAILAGYGFSRIGLLQWPGVRFGRIVRSLILLILLLNLVQVFAATVRRQTLQYLFAGSNAQEFLQHNLGMYALATQAVDELPEGSRTLLLWEPRSLYCLPDCDPDESLDNWATAGDLSNDPGEMLREWQTAGYSHILIYISGAEIFRSDGRLSAEDRQTLDDIMAAMTPVVDLQGVYSLFKLP